MREHAVFELHMQHASTYCIVHMATSTGPHQHQNINCCYVYTPMLGEGCAGIATVATPWTTMTVPQVSAAIACRQLAAQTARCKAAS